MTFCHEKCKVQWSSHPFCVKNLKQGHYCDIVALFANLLELCKKEVIWCVWNILDGLSVRNTRNIIALRKTHVLWTANDRLSIKLIFTALGIFAVWFFTVRVFRRTEISPYGIFAVRNFRLKDFSPWGLFAVRNFRRTKTWYIPIWVHPHWFLCFPYLIELWDWYDLSLNFKLILCQQIYCYLEVRFPKKFSETVESA